MFRTQMLPNRHSNPVKPIALIICLCLFVTRTAVAQDKLAENPDGHQENSRLVFEALPDLPDNLGVAGPIVGYHDVDPANVTDASPDFLIVAAGSNFGHADDPQLWDLPKIYHDRVWVLQRSYAGNKTCFQWRDDIGDDFRLSQPVGYSSVVSTKFGVLVIGGQNADGMTNRAFLLRLTKHNGNWRFIENDKAVPDLPLKSTAGGAAIVGDYVYAVGGEIVAADGTRSASRMVWRLKLDFIDPQKKATDANTNWEQIVSWPEEGPRRMFPLVTAQHDGFTTRLLVLGGRRFLDGTDKSDLYNLKFASDCWSFDPSTYDANKFDSVAQKYEGKNPWKRIADAPVPITAGAAVAYGPAHVIVPAYATGEALNNWLDSKIAQQVYDHPGFPREALAYHTVTDTWTSIGSIPAAQVTTPAVVWGDDIFLISGEIRPRVRTNRAWRIRIPENKSRFGAVNMTIVVLYLLAMLGVGAYFTVSNKTTDDFFRGGKSIPWWAAGCSIFATMLSSITFMAIPAKAFAQDWVYAMGSVLILGVAPIAIYVALPFFRRIDATSAYEYLEKRFNRAVRLIGSGSFSLFHIFRMGIVLALAALALASVTPLTPAQCVIVMGVLSIIYCTLGGIEAVIWTDTLQTIILLGGAMLCLWFALLGSDPGSLNSAVESGKFHFANLDFGPTSFTTMAIWVVILGGFGQNLASYTADQAVVQRYMTTSDEKQAANSIWLNGLMAIPAAVIFFGMGTAFWMFYRSHPEKLDPAIATDRILPLFISQELPVGLAGLVVAGIFAAAQSTVSTSMNSGATTIVTDFLRPFRVCNSETAYLWSARTITLVMGILGTAVGLMFVNPDIKSLFDQFIGILGMFLGVLAGLFALGATTRRANGWGSLIGAAVSIALMMLIVFSSKDKSLFGINLREICESVFGFELYRVNGYLYAFVGIVICYLVGYFASLLVPSEQKPHKGLTLFDVE